MALLPSASLGGHVAEAAGQDVDATPAAYQAWRNAIVQIGPTSSASASRGMFGRLRHIESLSWRRLPAGAKLPVVLYLHDCPGLKIEAMRDIEELAAIGFAVFAPDSFDNRARKSDCVRFDFVAGLNPDAYVQRQAEIMVALTRAAQAALGRSVGDRPLWPGRRRPGGGELSRP